MAFLSACIEMRCSRRPFADLLGHHRPLHMLSFDLVWTSGTGVRIDALPGCDNQRMSMYLYMHAQIVVVMLVLSNVKLCTHKGTAYWLCSDLRSVDLLILTRS